MAISFQPIDGAYPVAGQDNNSQGFRDNFTNTNSNFTATATAINDLQTNVLLKQALTGTTLNNNMLGAPITNGVISGFSATRAALGSLSGSVSLNYSAGHFQTLTTSGNVSLVLPGTGNWPVAGTTGILTLQVTVQAPSPYTTPYTLTFPGQVSVNNLGILGISSNVITFAPSGTATVGIYTFQFISSDGGSTYTVNQVNNLLQPFNSTSEDLAASAAANLQLTTSYFTTAAAEVASLAAGVNGQIKVFAMAGDGGDMAITVANAGWKSSGPGTITFNTIGQACTLQYISSKWFCIGNNGAAFT